MPTADRAARLKESEFYAHADPFMSSTAELADIVLPVASAFEREGMKIGFDISADAVSARSAGQPKYTGPPARQHRGSPAR